MLDYQVKLKYASELAMLVDDYSMAELLQLARSFADADGIVLDLDSWSYQDTNCFVFDRLVDEYLNMDDYELLDIYNLANQEK